MERIPAEKERYLPDSDCRDIGSVRAVPILAGQKMALNRCGCRVGDRIKRILPEMSEKCSGFVKFL